MADAFTDNNGDKAKKFNTLVELEETASERRAHRPGAVTARNIDDSYIVGIILARYSTDNVFRTEPNVNLRVTDPEFFHAPQGETSRYVPGSASLLGFVPRPPFPHLLGFAIR